MKKTFLFLAAIFASVVLMAETATVTLTNAKISATNPATSYANYAITDDAGNIWKAFAIKNYQSKATAENLFLQIKKYANNVAYYIQVPEMPGLIQSITMTVSSTSTTMDGGGNSATLYFSESKTTSATGEGVASGTGASSVTIDASGLKLTEGYITAGGATRIWDITVTYEKGSAPTLASLEIQGAPEKMHYYVGEEFDITGLTVQGTYSDASTKDLSSQVEWTVTPAMFSEVAASASVKVEVSKGSINGEKTITNIVVEARPADIYAPVALDDIVDGGLYFITASYGDQQYYLPAGVYSSKPVPAAKFDAALTDESGMWHFTKGDEGWIISAGDTADIYFIKDNSGVRAAKGKGVEFSISADSTGEFLNLMASDGENNRYLSLYKSPDWRSYKNVTTSEDATSAITLYAPSDSHVAKPVFSVTEPKFSEPFDLAITCATDKASINYSLDTMKTWLPYSEPIRIADSTSIYAYAFIADEDTSVMAHIAYAKVEPKVLDTIAIADYKTELYQNDAFDFGGKVMAHYTGKDYDDEDVTANATFSGYDMATLGNQTVTVSYTEGKVTRTQTYSLTIIEKPAPSEFQTTYTSNITDITGYSVTWDEENYPALKTGTGKAAGSATITIPASTITLHFHAAGWNKENVTLDVNGETFTLVADAGIQGTVTTYELVNDPAENDYFTLTTNGATEVTFTATAGKRFVIFGVNAELDPDAIMPPTFSPAATEFVDSMRVSLSAVPGADIFYTLNEENITSMNAILYTEPIRITETTTIYAIAKNGGKQSDIVYQTYKAAPVFESLEDLVNELPAAEQPVLVKVAFEDVAIDSFFVSTNKEGVSFRNGVYATIDGEVVEFYCKDVPEGWEVGGLLAANIVAQWLLYKNSVAELSDFSWDDFDYTAPTAIGATTAQEKAVKVLLNDRVIIFRQNRLYSILGTRIE